jgi:hypothetical protein
MPQFITPHQNSLGKFSDRAAVEAAIQTLEAAGFSRDGLAIMPESLVPKPAVKETEAARGAGGGAVAGSVFGGMAGLLLGLMNVLASPLQSELTPVVIGLTLAGAGVGAGGGSLLGALSGVEVRKVAAEPLSEPIESYVLVAEQATPEQVTQARELLQDKIAQQSEIQEGDEL